MPAYLWREVYMAMCHNRNIVPICAMQWELKKKEKERIEQMKTEGAEDAAEGCGDSTLGD